jgi:hypothetical protein
LEPDLAGDKSTLLSCLHVHVSVRHRRLIPAGKPRIPPRPGHSTFLPGERGTGCCRIEQ